MAEVLNGGLLPADFVACMVEELGAERAERLFDALDGESSTTIRLNPAKCQSIDELGKIGEAERVPWSERGYYLSERPRFTYDSAFHAGAYYVQEASSHFVGHILGSVMGEEELQGAKILDTCAAPGGKSTLYSSLVGSEGLVVAAEINKGRASVLADNARKWGVGNIVVVNSDVEPLAQFEKFYDVVAVDAPCSGEGMFRKMSDARNEWSAASVAMCADRQGEILRTAWGALKSGGVLIYSTCTFNRTENEGVLAAFEEWADGEVCRAESVEVGDDWGIKVGEEGAFQTFRFMPGVSRGEGFFVAVARKSFDAGGRPRIAKGRKKIFTNLSNSELKECRSWVAEPNRMAFCNVMDTVYGYYEVQANNIKALAESQNVIYSGVAMGQILKGRLNPNGALALFAGLRREQLNVAQLSEEDMLSYLRRGDVAAVNFSEGLNLVTDESGFAVGFAKRVGARVNNRYLTSLRILK